MDVIGQHLDAHNAARLNAEDRARASSAWQIAGKDPADRLLAFDRWVRLELEARLEWGWAGVNKEKRIEQCRIRLEQVVRDLWRRGWMLDGKRLAARITSLLDAIGKYQRAGTVKDFWSYFGSCVDRYVGANAEEIHIEAMRVGAHVGQLLGALGLKSGAPAVAMPELIATRAAEIAKWKEETFRQRLSLARARQAACKAAADQPELFGR